ncbi:hypothetical protein O4J56_06915 [Nocardiopsis sp. RSe5-2]|uniref:DUF3307 domain-containing protein n=1 Tax=Nocardiopsis endophytica TaxID=3018445 RepID=A0ABT4U108_9ACTN|nr:hypothetical protein [Nocardiopsis endophytica]MDA2810366.1 hypothetical protein [Nocardiopsis endophytica]
MHADPIVFLLTAAALVPGHYLGDYGLQTDEQARGKGACTHEGRKACAGHVASLTLAQLVMLALVAVVTGTAMDPVAVALGLGVNAVSHYWADRRATLRGLVLADERRSSKIGFFDGGGAERVDQAWHKVWIVPAALVAASPVPLALALAIAAAAVLAVCDIASWRARRAEQFRNQAASAV